MIRDFSPDWLVLSGTKGAIQVERSAIRNVECIQGDVMNRIEVVTESATYHIKCDTGGEAKTLFDELIGEMNK